MKKKFIAMLLVTAMAAGLAACGSSKTSDTETNTETSAEDGTETAEEDADIEEEVEELTEYDPVLYEDLTSTIVSLGEYKGLEAEKTVDEVTDEDVQEEIDSKKQEYAELVDVDRAAEEGDVVVIDFTGYVDGETSDSLQGTEYSLELGSGTFVSGFEDQLIGVSADEDVEVNVTFPEEYYEDMAGKDARFEVHVYSVQEYQIEDWSDDFVKENMGYDSIADMEASVRQDLEDTAEENAQSDWEYALLTILLDNSEYEIQDADVDAYTDQMLSEYESYATAMGVDLDTLLQTYFGTTEDEMRLLYHDSAVFRVKMTLTFHDIAELEGMEISQEEYDEYTAGLAEQYGYDDGEAFEAAYSEELIREQLIQEKVLDFLCENAKTE